MDERVRRGPEQTEENNVKYMLIMRATDEALESFQDFDFDQMLETMGRFNDELINAGVLVAMDGLEDAAQTVVVDYSSQPPIVTDGPYGEAKELFGGFWILDVASKEEAVEWARRVPFDADGQYGPDAEIEIRQIFESEDFGAEFTPELREQEERLRAQAEKLAKTAKP